MVAATRVNIFNLLVIYTVQKYDYFYDCILNISFEGTGEWTFNLESLRYRLWEHCQRAVDKSCM